MTTINYPKSWADVTIAQYLDFYRAVKPYSNTEEYGDKAILHGIFNFTDILEEDYLSMPEKEIAHLQIQIAQLLAKTDIKLLARTFTIDKVKYGLIPSFDEMAYGEYLDLVTYTKKDLWDNMAIVMAILYRPVIDDSGTEHKIEKYNGTPEDRIQLFKDKCTMDYVFGTLSFFLDLQRDLLIGTQIYLQEMLKTVGKKGSPLQMDLEKNGLDTIQLQYLQEMISSNLTTLQNSQSTNV
jgi:hypothetical protein